MTELLLVVGYVFLLAGAGAAISDWLLPVERRRSAMASAELSRGANEQAGWGWSYLIGAAVVGITFYLPLALTGRISHRYFSLVTGACLALTVFHLARRTRARGFSLKLPLNWIMDLPPALRAGMIAVFAAAALSVVSAKSTGFDARAIYGLKARLLYDAGSISTEDFQDVDRMHFNAHYPLLIPLHEAALFNLQQSTSDRFHRIFFFAFIVALGSAMAREFRRMFSRQLSALFTAGLICLPSILLTWEGAGLTGAVDFPLACFATAGVLATMRWVRMQDSRQALLAGAMFGAAVLTKSEGMLWVGAAGTAMLALMVLRRVPVDRTTWKQCWAGACLLLMVIVVYRAVREQIPYSPHLRSYAAALHWDWLRQLWARPFQVAWYGLRDSVRPKYWNFAWVCVAAALVLRRQAKLSSDVLIARITLALLACIFYAIFVITPYHVYWQMGTALHRLLLQMFPLAWLVAAENLKAAGWIGQLEAHWRQSAADVTSDNRPKPAWTAASQRLTETREGRFRRAG